MKKLYAVLAGILLFGILTAGFDQYLEAEIKDSREAVRNHRSYERFWSSETQKLIMDENTLLIFGSSELTGLKDYKDEISNFLNAPDMNIITMGAGNFQSLSHTMELGAAADAVSSKKIALFLSPQWFEEAGISADAFPERFGEEALIAFLKNDRISDANKKYVLDRTLTLLENSPVQYSRVEKYKNAFENKIGIDNIYTDMMYSYWKLRGKYSVFKQIGRMEQELPAVDFEHMDFEKMLQLAEAQGEAVCTNNDFGIYDDYWDTYVKETYEQGEVEDKTEIFTESIEYEDLTCFLNVAEELDIEVIVVSIPVNEQWYAYQGMLCDEYYNKIRETVGEFNNAVLIDMTEYADEKYFLKDIMHLGWKGWVRIGEALYEEFKKQ